MEQIALFQTAAVNHRRLIQASWKFEWRSSASVVP
jgi:hypothetical protein